MQSGWFELVSSNCVFKTMVWASVRVSVKGLIVGNRKDAICTLNKYNWVFTYFWVLIYLC